MKNFLNRVKNMLSTVAVWTAFIVVAVCLVAFAAVNYVYDTIVRYVRGAGSWIADKYNNLVAKFKTEVLVETTEETSQA